MAKKSKGRVPEEKPGEAGRRPTVQVRDRSDVLHPFLRGMVAHDLVQRGLPFEDAYAAARAVRDRLVGREEISTAELKELIDRQVETMFGGETVAQLSPASWPRPPEIEVAYHGRNQPFSRGLLARSLAAAGVDLDRAYRLSTDLQAQLRQEGIQRLSSEEVARRAGELLERMEGPGAAGRYRMVRRIQRLNRPLVIYLGGASGTGKSTLGLELAPLLRIYRINATDTIRQVMRMLVAPAILPSLHTSSFEAPLQFEATPLDLAERPAADAKLTAAFTEQATRVCVGVRAVVERAIVENMSVIVEGVHLIPPIVPFSDLEGAVHQISILLTTLNEETHRSRFLSRSRVAPRTAERYLENFGAIRALQDHMIELAEAWEVPLFDTSDGESATPRAVRLVTGLLHERLPWLGGVEPEPGAVTIPTLLLVIDGLPDHPTRALGGRTPLSAAQTPTLDRLAREGQTGLCDPVAPDVVPDTASGTLALLGQSPLAMKRGPVEALGTDLDVEPGDIAVRGNLATLSAEGKVVDRRAGRIRGEALALAEALDRLEIPGAEGEEVEVRVRATTEHRLSIVLRGPRLSSAVQGSDPGDGAPPGPPLAPRPLDPRDEAAVHTARLLALFEAEARRILAAHPVNKKRQKAGLPPANTVLTRGAGRVYRLPALERHGLPLSFSCISGDLTILGLAVWVGGRAITGPEMTANLDTDVEAKLEKAEAALAEDDLVVVHLKGADIASHDQRPDLKVAYLEQVDRALGELLSRWEGRLRVAVASDHATLSEGGHHAADPVPVLIWGPGIEADKVTTFDERSVAEGSLGRFPLQLLLGRVMQLD